uniref:PGG domain-containing protein n=1 Tax=Opuntia streptacantha TaxID=393608 RepID=A0A7C9AYM4_OPUST
MDEENCRIMCPSCVPYCHNGVFVCISAARWHRRWDRSTNPCKPAIVYERDFLRSLPLKLMFGLTALFVSIATMVAAFTATFFLTFRKGVRWIPIPIAVFASVPITLFASQQFPLLIDIYRSTYRGRSLFQHGQQKLFRNHSTQ